MKVRLQEVQQGKPGVRRCINKLTNHVKPLSMNNNNLHFNPVTLKAAFVLATCMFLILHYIKF